MSFLNKLISLSFFILISGYGLSSAGQEQPVLKPGQAQEELRYNIYFEPGMAEKYSANPAVVSYFRQLDRLTVRITGGFPLEYWKKLPGFKVAYPANRSFEFLGIQELNHARANYLHSSLTYNLRGDSIKIGQFDASTVQTHVDFMGRVIQLGPQYSGSIQSHATQVFGLMAGAGTRNPRAIGVAPRATVYSWDIYRDIPTAMDSLGKLGVHLMQHAYAYSTTSDSCLIRGRYDDFSNEVDFLVKFFPKMVQIVACGNFQSQCGMGGYRTIPSGLQAAKNIITVGTITANDLMSTNSSFGPVRDGRLKPEIVAQGTAVFTTNPPNGYISNINGTSYSSAVVSGAVALLQQQYLRKFGSFPNCELVKAILINTAEDLGNPGPDFKFGYGKLNSLKAIQFLDSGAWKADAIQENDYFIDTITAPPGAKSLKVTLVYNDYPGTAFAARSLVHDLDLSVQNDTGAVFLPFVLDTSAANLNNNALRGRDSLNNTEQVVIDNPSGKYVVRIFGKSIATLQSFVYVYQFERPVLQLTYPAGKEHFDPGTTVQLRWNAFHLSDSMKLYYSVDSGSNWLPVDTLIPAGKQFTNWLVPDSVTAKAFIKIVSGSRSSMNILPFNIYRPFSDTFTFEDCSEISSVSWRSQPKAARYHLYKLNGAEMQKIATLTDTSYRVGGLSNFSTYWFALQLEAANGALSQRSVAQEHTLNSSVLSARVDIDPLDIHVCAGDTATFEAKISGSGVLDIFWQSRDSSMAWDSLPGTSDTMLRVTATGSKLVREYRIIVSNLCNADTSAGAKLFVDTVPQFILHPKDTIICSGQNISFKARSSGSADLQFWQIQLPDSAWKDVAIDSVLQLNSVQYSYNGARLRMTASNVCGIDTSDEALLTVRPPLSFSLPDTIWSCRNVILLIPQQSSGGDSTKYRWAIEQDTISALPLTFTPQKDTSLSIHLFDNCSVAGVSDDIYIRVDTTKGGFNYAIDYPVKNDPKQIRFIPYDSAVSYTWYFGDGDSSQAKSPTHLYAALGSYLVTQKLVTDSGCEIIFTRTIQVVSNVSVKETAERKLNIHPNPANDYFDIYIPGTDLSHAELIISDASGRELKNIGIIEAKNEICRVRLNGTAQGIYQVRLITRGNVFTGKLLIMD